MNVLIPSLVCYMLILPTSGTKTECNRTLEDFATWLKAKDGYDNSLRPNATGSAVVVSVQMYILSLGPVDQTNMEFTIDMYFRQSWQDTALCFTPPSRSDHVNFPPDMGRRLWKPDTYFENGRNPQIPTIPADNLVFRVYGDGRVLFSSRISTKVTCHMNFENYPMDKQECYLKMSSYSNTEYDIVYKWEKPGVLLNPGVKLSQFDIEKPSTRVVTEVYSIGSFVFLFADFRFHRRLTSYLSGHYLPAAFIVILSWVNFWLWAESTPARTALCAITVLSMTTFIRSDHVIKASYSTALEVYMFGCFVFVFFSLIEFGVVHYVLVLRPRHQSLKEQGTVDEEKVSDEDGVDHLGFQNGIHQQEYFHNKTVPLRSSTFIETKHYKHNEQVERSASSQCNEHTDRQLLYWQTLRAVVGSLDKYCRIVLPLLFALFNAIYWKVYLSN